MSALEDADEIIHFFPPSALAAMATPHRSNLPSNDDTTTACNIQMLLPDDFSPLLGMSSATRALLSQGVRKLATTFAPITNPPNLTGVPLLQLDLPQITATWLGWGQSTLHRSTTADPMSPVEDH